MFAPCWLLIGIVVTGAGAADAVTLADGSVVLGQVQGTAPAGGLIVLVRRDWARSKIAARLARWEREEALLVRRARRDRKERLLSWRRERADGDDFDPLATGIDRETGRLSTLRPPRTVLTALPLGRNEVRNVSRRNPATARLLRLGWLAGLPNVETITVDELRAALTLRGRLRDETDPALIDALLPLYPESASRWELRRAATEVVVEPGVRFVRYRELILPEGEPDAEPQNVTELIDSPTGRAAFGAIQAITPFDAEQQRLNGVANRGLSGAIFSRVSYNVDSDQAEATAVLWVRSDNDGRWSSALTRSAVASRDEPAGTTAPPGSETGPVRTAALVLETVASTPSPPGVSERRQEAGAVGQRALARARAALDRDLAPLLLPVVAGGRN